MELKAKAQLVQAVGGVWCRPTNDVAIGLCAIAGQKTLSPRLVELAQDIGIIFEYSYDPVSLDSLLDRWVSSNEARQKALAKVFAEKKVKKAAKEKKYKKPSVPKPPNKLEQMVGKNTMAKEYAERGHDDETALDLLGVSSDEFTDLLRTEEGRKQLEERAEKDRLKISS
mgnify:CR=1 FL=1|tara:strand:+ start:2993 stop:3502 length:510 start_codon:yes stop_codon:yes gene_type:complete